MITTKKTMTVAVMITIETTIIIVRGKRKPNVGPLHYIKEL